MAPSEQHKERVRSAFEGEVIQGQVLSGAEMVSRSLKDISREMRRPAPVWAGNLGQQAERLKSSFGAWVILAFVSVVVVPVLAAGLYLAIFAADQYASEARFAVRGGERGPIDPLSAISGASAGHAQDSLIIADYIRGQGMVTELEKTLNLREMFSTTKADWLFSFNPDKSIEKLVRYWRWQVDVNVDSMSGIITVLVRAFTPEDALAISKAIIVASEKLVNDLSERARRDALKQAQSELTLAENTLQDRIKAMRDLRNREGILDATKTSDAMTKLTGDLRLELARMESEYASSRRSVSETSPQMRVLEARIRSARDQLRLIEGRMTQTPRTSGGAATGNASSDPALADSMGRFDRLNLEQGFAQKQYVEAAAAFERARMELDSQHVYLATFLQPVLAQDALFPKKGWILAALAAICLVLWSVGVGAAVLARNYVA
jgi:capsular polysaccharide transport system permease protein